MNIWHISKDFDELKKVLQPLNIIAIFHDNLSILLLALTLVLLYRTKWIK